MSTEQSPRDRLDRDTVDVTDRADGPEPVEQTEGTIGDAAAHEPRVAAADQQTSDAIAEEAGPPADAADDHRVEDNNAAGHADGDRTGQEPMVRDSLGPPREDEAAGLSDSPDDMTAVSSSAASDDAIDRSDEPRGIDPGERGEDGRGEDDLDRQYPRSATDLADASDTSGEAADAGVDRGEEIDRAAAADGSPADGAERPDIQVAPAAAAVPGEQPSDGLPGGEETLDGEDAGALLPRAETYRLRIRWREAQLGFVDDPRQAVDDAAELVSAAVDRVASLLRDQVGSLDVGRSSRDAGGGEADTEQLRTLMRRYHALLDRMLAV